MIMIGNKGLVYFTGDGIDGVILGLFKFSGGDDDSLLTPPLTAFILNLESNKEPLELFVLHPEKFVFKNVNHSLILH